jgi:hypothetical protein
MRMYVSEYVYVVTEYCFSCDQRKVAVTPDVSRHRGSAYSLWLN